MSLIYIVRHGQASFAGPHYDNLSPLGLRQVRELGEDWLRRGLRWDLAVIGPKKRHRQTAEGVIGAYTSAGVPFPEPLVLPEFDEHQGASLVKKILSNDLEREHDHALMPSFIQTESRIQAYFRRFQELTRRWARRELEDEDFECWQSFIARVRSGLQQTLAQAGPDARIAVFTSGGPVAVCTGLALDLSDERILELSWRIRNCACLEARRNGEALDCVSVNLLPHFSTPEMVTDI